MDADVLVVGAGPTGLMLANQLARWGVRTIIVDRHAGPATQTRALGVQARTLEIYAHLGFIDRALELGKRAIGANLWAQGKRSARIPVGDIGQGMSPYPFLLILGQDDNEKLLGERLRAQGSDVRWNTELVALEQRNDHVKATLRLPDGKTSDLTVAWVGGCDGVRSTVRDSNGIEFVGAPYEHVFFVADTVVTGSMVPDELNVYLWRQGFHLFFPMRGQNHWRVVGILPSHLRARTDLTFDEVIPYVRQEAGTELAFESCSWYSTYRIHHRRAARFRAERCFLLGDAAHVHSPVGAQGMNTGLQDAYNLAWKLALVVSRRADATLLDTYESERIPVATRLLASTDRAFSLFVSDSFFAGIFRTRIVAKIAALAMSVERIRKLAFLTISQIGIRYPGSALSQTEDTLPAEAPQPGDRFPWVKLRLAAGEPVEDIYAKLDDTRFHLLVFGQRAPAEGIPALGALLELHEIPRDATNDAELKRAGIPAPSFYLLRPDGHVGLAGTQLSIDAITQFVSIRLGLRS